MTADKRSEHTEKNICYFRAGVMWTCVLFGEIFILMAMLNALHDTSIWFLPLFWVFGLMWLYVRSGKIPSLFIRLALKKGRKARRK